MICALFLITASLPCAAAGGPVRDEHTALEEERAALEARIDVLGSEQEYLLFQKAMRDVDSKYLVINRANRTARLKYKNRVLKEIRLRTSKNFPALKPGMLTLTKKIAGRKDRHALVFGNAFLVQWKPSAKKPREAELPVISLTRKELLSVFYSLEEGALVYLEP